MTKQTTKDYVIKKIPQTALYKVHLEGGGEVAKDLNGAYTSPTRAHDAIATYNDNHNVDRKVSTQQ